MPLRTIRLRPEDVIFVVPVGFPCPRCNADLPGSAECGERFVAARPALCVACGQSSDWWDVVLRAVRDDVPPLQSPFQLIGGVSVAFRASLSRGTALVIDFADLGKPES